MAHEVFFSPEAVRDLDDLTDYVSAMSGRRRADAYVDRIEAFCRNLADFPERGARRDDLFPGLRIVGFEGRLSIAFHLDGQRLVFDRFFYGGRDLDAAFERD